MKCLFIELSPFIAAAKEVKWVDLQNQNQINKMADGRRNSDVAVEFQRSASLGELAVADHAMLSFWNDTKWPFVVQFGGTLFFCSVLPVGPAFRVTNSRNGSAKVGNLDKSFASYKKKKTSQRQIATSVRRSRAVNRLLNGNWCSPFAICRSWPIDFVIAMHKRVI